MGMRLLPKSEILAKQASQKKQEIDQGTLLAKKIDTLRETYAEEESKLATFRKEQWKAINDELAPLAKERDGLKAEVKGLKKERQELLKPLDAEWKEVRDAKSKAIHDTENAKSLLITAQEADRQAKRAVKQASDRLSRAADKEERARQLLSEASSKEREVAKRLVSAKKVEEKALKVAEEMRQELLARDNEVARREHGCTIKEANLTEREADLAKGWKLLEDRRAAFERQINRAKK